MFRSKNGSEGNLLLDRILFLPLYSSDHAVLFTTVFVDLPLVSLEVLFLGRSRGARAVPSRDALLIHAAKCTGMNEVKIIV